MATIDEKSTENAEKYGSCTANKCFTNEIIKDNDMLQCRKCQRFVHYACSELPAYQIQLCLQYKSRRFECKKCVTVTPILLEKIKTSKQRVRSNQITQTITEAECKDGGQQIFESVFNTRLHNLEKKMEELIAMNKEDVAKEPKRATYADITKEEVKKQEVIIKKFIKNEKEEREEDRWKNLTRCNIIVHHLGENKDENKEEQRAGDKDYVEEVVGNRMGLKINVVTAERIGARKDDMFKTKRWRPLKVTLANEVDKKRIMASVHKLNEDNFSVTDDFSKKERKTIKEWHEKAKEKMKNEKDECCVWKVRGSPRAKLYFKKICKKNVIDEL